LWPAHIRSRRAPPQRPAETKHLPHPFTYLPTVTIDGECLPVASERSGREMYSALARRRAVRFLTKQ
jgi:hypothetical protein